MPDSGNSPLWGPGLLLTERFSHVSWISTGDPSHLLPSAGRAPRRLLGSAGSVPIRPRVPPLVSWPHLAAGLNAERHTVRFHLLMAVGYGVALWCGRLLVLPGSGIAATWPSVGAAYLWLLPLLGGQAWYRRPGLWLAVCAIIVSTTVTNLSTGLLPVLTLTIGVCNAVAALVAGRLQRRSHLDGEPFTARRLRQVVGYAVLATLAAWPTFPLAAVQLGLLTWADTAFWLVRNGVTLYLFAAGAGVLAPTDHPRARGVGAPMTVFITVTTLAAMVFAGRPEVNYVLAFLVMTLGIGMAVLMSSTEVYLYLMCVTGTVTAMSVLGHSPFGGDTPLIRSVVVHAVMGVTVGVACTLALDREERTQLLLRLEAERAETIRHAELLAAQARLLGTIVGSMSEGGWCSTPPAASCSAIRRRRPSSASPRARTCPSAPYRTGGRAPPRRGTSGSRATPGAPRGSWPSRPTRSPISTGRVPSSSCATSRRSGNESTNSRDSPGRPHMTCGSPCPRSASGRTRCAANWSRLSGGGRPRHGGPSWRPGARHWTASTRPPSGGPVPARHAGVRRGPRRSRRA